MKDLEEKLKQEAQIHAQEARTQKAIVHEIYQHLGIQKSDWNGARPVKRIFDQLKKENEEKLDITEFVKKIIGPIDPVGESNTDEKRYKNLNTLISLVWDLLYSINYVACNNKNRVESSMKQVGQKAESFLKNIHEEFNLENR